MYANTYLPSVPRTTTSHCDMQRDKDSGILAAAWPRGGAQRLQTGGEGACNSERHIAAWQTLCTVIISPDSETLLVPNIQCDRVLQAGRIQM